MTRAPAPSAMLRVLALATAVLAVTDAAKPTKPNIFLVLACASPKELSPSLAALPSTMLSLTLTAPCWPSASTLPLPLPPQRRLRLA